MLFERELKVVSNCVISAVSPEAYNMLTGTAFVLPGRGQLVKANSNYKSGH